MAMIDTELSTDMNSSSFPSTFSMLEKYRGIQRVKNLR
jgi:hypothetical protein